MVFLAVSFPAVLMVRLPSIVISMAEGRRTAFPSCSTAHVMPLVPVTAVTFSVPSGEVTTHVFSLAAHTVDVARSSVKINVVVFIMVINS